MYVERALGDGGVLWHSSSSESTTIPADGCVDVILRDEEVLLIGPSTRCLVTDADGESPTVGIRFAPGSVTEFLGINPAEIRDVRMEIGELLSRSRAGAIRRAMSAVASHSDLSPLVQARLASHAPTDGWIRAVRDAAASRQRLRSIRLDLGWSERHLRRRMVSSFGYGYSTLVRIERARQAHALIAAGGLLGQTAVAVGYADQSHMTREFSRFIGRTPSQRAISSA